MRAPSALQWLGATAVLRSWVKVKVFGLVKYQDPEMLPDLLGNVGAAEVKAALASMGKDGALQAIENCVLEVHPTDVANGPYVSFPDVRMVVTDGDDELEPNKPPQQIEFAAPASPEKRQESLKGMFHVLVIVLRWHMLPLVP